MRRPDRASSHETPSRKRSTSALPSVPWRERNTATASCRPECSERAAAFGTNPRSRAIDRMREASSGRTVLVPMRPLRTLDTSERETPASAAMSRILTDVIVVGMVGMY